MRECQGGAACRGREEGGTRVGDLWAWQWRVTTSFGKTETETQPEAPRGEAPKPRAANSLTTHTRTHTQTHTHMHKRTCTHAKSDTHERTESFEMLTCECKLKDCGECENKIKLNKARRSGSSGPSWAKVCGTATTQMKLASRTKMFRIRRSSSPSSCC